MEKIKLRISENISISGIQKVHETKDLEFFSLSEKKNKNKIYFI